MLMRSSGYTQKFWLRIFGNRSIIWSSSDNKCDSIGPCGLNEFCTNVDGEAKCLCLPGFAHFSRRNWSSGCERNFTIESCQCKNGSMKYTMEATSYTV